MSVRQRFAGLEGCANFRDLGGYPVGSSGITLPGVLYRSDSLHRLTPADGHRLQSELGVTTAVDLRTDRERDLCGVAPEIDGLTVHHVPTVDATMQAPMERADVDSILAGYETMLELAGANLGAAARVLAESDGPAVFFCMAGKDRTGLLAALLLGLVGVDDDTIAEDYALTSLVIDGIVERIAVEQPGSAERWQHLAADVLSAEPITMTTTLAMLHRRWGGYAAYAAHIGLDTDHVNELRRRLVLG